MSSQMKTSDAKKMGVLALTLVTASNMMGSGVFLLPTNLGKIGAISIFGWIVTIIGVLALALVFAKTALIHLKIGGIVSYARDAFGPFVGFQSTVAYWVSAWIGNVALLVAGVGYLAYFFPILKDPNVGPTYSCILAIIILCAYLFLSSFGAKIAGSAQSFTAICGLIVILGVGIFGWFFFNPTTYFSVINDTGDSNFSAIISAASLALWGFLGVESAVVSTGQVENPEKTVPKATVMGLLIASFCYVASTTVIMGIVPHEVLSTSSAPFADAVRYMFDSELAGSIASALSVLACFGSISGWFILQSEAPRAAAESGLFPKWFADLNKNGTPMKSLIFTAVLMSIVLLMTANPNLADQFEVIILISVYCSLLPYIYAVAALPILWTAKKLNKAGNFKIYTILEIIAILYCMFALVGSGADSIFYGTLLVTFMIPVFCFPALKLINNGKLKLETEDANVKN